jgi:hypothetical protein
MIWIRYKIFKSDLDTQQTSQNCNTVPAYGHILYSLTKIFVFRLSEPWVIPSQQGWEPGPIQS